MTTRLLWLARFLEGIYVLHAFEKRTSKTSRSDLELARTRYREVLEHRRRQVYGKG
jgi:phage-related protein